MTSTQLPGTQHQQLYETDFLEWVSKTADLLKQGKFSELDVENLTEEVEDLGRREKRALESNLRVVLIHLLKWQYQPNKRSGSWEGSIREHRKRIQSALDDSPSLENYCGAIIEDSHSTAREIAAAETGLEIQIFPAQCPYTAKQIFDKEFWPEP